MNEVLHTYNLLIGYKGQPLLPEVNVGLCEGDIVALAGPNGSGKTTLFKTLSATLKPIGGEVKLFGKDLLDLHFEWFVLRPLGPPSYRKRSFNKIFGIPTICSFYPPNCRGFHSFGWRPECPRRFPSRI